MRRRAPNNPLPEPRAKLSALSLSCLAQKAGGLQSVANPARRIRLAPVLYAPENKRSTCAASH